MLLHLDCYQGGFSCVWKRHVGMWGLTQLSNFGEANGLRGALSESLLRVCSHNRKMVLGKNLFQITKCGFGKDPSNPHAVIWWKSTLWFGNSLKMENSALPRHMIWPDLKIQTPILSRGIGYGSLTPYQKSSTTYGFSTTIASQFDKSLLLGAYLATRVAPYARARRNPSYIY